MHHPPQLGLDDHESLTRDSCLSIVHACSEHVETFDVSLFAGFTSMRALTYTASIRMIVHLLSEFNFNNFECVFGHEGVLRPEISDALAFQAVVQEQLSRVFIGVETSEERRQALFDKALVLRQIGYLHSPAGQTLAQDQTLSIASISSPDP